MLQTAARAFTDSTMTFAAIDFGTSNSAVWVGGNRSGLVALEDGKVTMPTAVFFNAEERSVCFGRQALREYQAAYPGRLLRSLKSLLGSDLMQEGTLINGKVIAYRDILAQFLSALKRRAESESGVALTQLMLGRPVFFIDDDPARDTQAQGCLAEIAQSVGFTDVQFQLEPIAAALDYESSLQQEALVLVADIGGGTSDFSLIRLGPDLAAKSERSADILANGGVHVAGTDFDQLLSLASVMPLLGYGTNTRAGRTMPAQIYFELATWHRIHALYAPKPMAAAADLRNLFADPTPHQRLMQVLKEREGHRIAGVVEQAKLTVAEADQAMMDLGFIEAGLSACLTAEQAAQSLAAALGRISAAARQTVADAGVAPEAVQAVYFTGGSTGLPALRAAIAAHFPAARVVRGEAFASVATGLGLHARRVFGA